MILKIGRNLAMIGFNDTQLVEAIKGLQPHHFQLFDPPPRSRLYFSDFLFLMKNQRSKLCLSTLLVH